MNDFETYLKPVLGEDNRIRVNWSDGKGNRCV